jgi:hypothetical protein
MKDWRTRVSVFHLSLVAIGLAVLTVLLVRHARQRESVASATQKEPAAGALTLAEPLPVAVPLRRSTPQNPASCQPDLRAPPLSVPNIAVNDRVNMAAVTLTIRMFVNSDGFVARAFATGFTVTTPADQEMELDFVQHLTFTVPNVEECRGKQMEMIGVFTESRNSGNEWATVFEVQPPYPLERERVMRRF